MYGLVKSVALCHRRCIFAVFLSVFSLSVPAQEQQGLKIELNKLESVDAACRAYVVFENYGSEAYESLKLDLVMFDSTGIINKRLAVEGAPLPPGKTSVKLFDIKDVSCEQVGRILLNDVLSCRSSSGERSDCLAEIVTTSRNAVSFFK